MDRRSGLESVGLRKKKNPSTKSTPMAVTVETLEVELGGATHAFPVIDLRDRRKRGNPKKRWALVRATELLLFDVHDRSRGRFAAHLVRSSMDDALLVAERAAVTSGMLHESELQAGAPSRLRGVACSHKSRGWRLSPPLDRPPSPARSARRDAQAARHREPLALPQGVARAAADPRLGLDRVRSPRAPPASAVGRGPLLHRCPHTLPPARDAGLAATTRRPRC